MKPWMWLTLGIVLILLGVGGISSGDALFGVLFIFGGLACVGKARA